MGELLFPGDAYTVGGVYVECALSGDRTRAAEVVDGVRVTVPTQ